MQTFSLFPQLLDFQMLGVFLLRVTLGLILLRFWYSQVILGRHAERVSFLSHLGLRPAKTYFYIISSIEGLTGLFLTIGLYTQGAAILAGILMLVAAIIKMRKPAETSLAPTEFYILFAVASLALLFLGPGAFAIDLPL